MANSVVAVHCVKGLPIPKLDNHFFYSCLAAVSKGWRAPRLKSDATASDKVFAEVASDHRSICESGLHDLPDLHLVFGFKQNGGQQLATNAKVRCFLLVFGTPNNDLMH